MRFSVVINTLNRAASLRTTLESLRHQHHGDFEVVVVNGPSTDDTEDVVAEWSGGIKHLRCPVANLSMSRNIGIRAAAGDVVAFIDDDAVPEYSWLSELEQGYTTNEVAGVGGVVYDHTGMHFQYTFGLSDRYGDTTQYEELPSADAMCTPGSWSYPSLLGTNSSFRRTALATIGLFDETYEYYLDETDVAVRLVDAGYLVTGLAGAPVHHHFLPSHVRNAARTVTHWYPVIKNRTYFALRHAQDHRSVSEILTAAVASAEQRYDECRWAEDHGMVVPGATRRAREGIDRGLLDGITLANRRGVGPLAEVDLDPPDFVPFPTHERRHGRRIALISSSYPPQPIGGISRFISELAPALARAGHDVRVITRATEHQHVSWSDGVWLHHIGDGARGLASGSFEHVDAFASSVVAELARLQRWTPVDAVYGGAWDVETLGVVRATAIPATVMLATPAAVAADEGGWWDDPSAAGPLRSLLALEAELFGTADLVHGISQAIVDTIEARYGDPAETLFGGERLEVFPLGMSDRAMADPESAERSTKAATILFVGRLEPRKGIDVFLRAIDRVLPDRADVRVIVAGADPQRAVTDRWEAEHATLRWADRVEFVGTTPDDELHRLYATATVVVLPSRYESFGLVVVEAMMHSAATVSSDVGGIAEVARNGIDALLVPPGDHDALASAIEQLLDDTDARARLGRAGRQRFEDRFAIDRCAAQVDRLVSRAVARSDAPVGPLELGRCVTIAGGLGTCRLAVTTSTHAELELRQRGQRLRIRIAAPGGRCTAGHGADPIEVVLIDGDATVLGIIDVTGAC